MVKLPRNKENIMIGMMRGRLSAVALGVASGVMCGGWMLAITFLAWKGQYPSLTTDMVTHWSSIFPGVELSMMGSFVAGAWGFLKGFFSGLVFGWIYNLCLCCCPRCCPCCKCSPCSSKGASCSTTPENK